jgi:uncharacterized protein (DUF169 family)
MNLSELSQQITDALQLASPPVSLTFVDEAPSGVPLSAWTVPSACAFWTRAEQGMFFAPAAAHKNCPVGMLAMGFPMDQSVMSALNDFISRMIDVSYLSNGEPDFVPGIAKARKGILYGPLSQFPEWPDFTLVWVNARQAMLLEEALGAVFWNAPDKAQVFGRPACGALAVAANENRSTLSLGCTGMRTFTKIGDEKLLVWIPGSELRTLSEKLESTMRSNAQMFDFYRQHEDVLTRQSEEKTYG